MKYASALIALAIFSMSTGCAASRAAHLRARSAEVETRLKFEQEKALALTTENRRERINHLTALRGTLSAANVGLGAVRYMPGVQRDIAYDVLEEVYGTIDWNIPLGAGEPLRPLPREFSGGVLKLQ